MTRRILVGCSATFAGAFDFGFMTLAAPALDRELALGAAYPWVFSAGSLAYGASVMPAGALAGWLRPQRMIMAGLLIAAAGAAAVACATVVATALAGRVLFGLGGGIAAAPALALLAGIEPPARRRAAFACVGGAVALGFAGGVLLAASVAPSLGWRGVLLGFASGLAALAILARAGGPRARRGATYGGALWFGASAIAATAALWTAAAAPLVAIPSFVIALALARSAWREASPWLPRARGATLAVCLAGGATTASGVGATVLLGRTLLDDSAADGLVLGAFGLVLLPAVAVAQRLARRLGPTGSAGAGLGVQASAIAALGLCLGAGTSALVLVAPLLLFGAGHVIANAGTADAVTGWAGAHAAPAAALLVTAQYVGGGAGALLVLGVADDGGPAAAMAVAAVVAALGALPLVLVSGEPRGATA